MKKMLSCSFLILFVLSLYAQAGVNVRLFGKHGDGKILSGGCVMSYTDKLGMLIRVVRGNQVIVFLK